MIGRLDTIAFDTPDPLRLAHFYGEILGLPITHVDDEWVRIGDPGPGSVSFQRAPDLIPPRWPDPAAPQQAHLDIWVDDVEVAEPAVLALGASLLRGGDDGFRVYSDPDGHPFCLVWTEHE